MNDLISDYAAVKCSPGGDWYEQPKRRKRMATKRRKRVRKQSGDRASRIAAAWLSLSRTNRGPSRTEFPWIDWKDLRTLCASVLSQDETKGKRK